jgi:hypothetical protein
MKNTFIQSQKAQRKKSGSEKWTNCFRDLRTLNDKKGEGDDVG